MKSVFRWAFVNLGVFVGLVMGLLFLASLAGDIHNIAKAMIGKDDKRASLPSYADKEHALQIFRDQRASIKQYVPFIEWRRTAYKSETVNIDDQGYRIHTSGLDNLPGATTIGFFGGSTMWGTGVDDNGTIPAQFDTITKNYKVVNYGERGFTTMQNLIELMTLINQGQAPKTVVFYEGFNDVWTHCNRAVTTRLNGHSEERRIQAALDRTSGENYLYNNIVSPIIAVIVRFGRIGEDTMEPVCSTNPAYAEKVAEMMVRNFEMGHELVTAYGGRFFLILGPTAFTGKPRKDYLDFSKPFDQALAHEINVVFPLVRQKMLVRGHDWFYDATNVLDGNGYYLIDHVHISDKGNARVAARIKSVVESGGVPSARMGEAQ